MAEFYLVVCKKPVPTPEGGRFQDLRELRRLAHIARLVGLDEQRDPTLYCYMGLAEPPDDAWNARLWLEKCDEAVVFRAVEDAEAAAFNLASKFPHFIGALEIFAYGG